MQQLWSIVAILNKLRHKHFRLTNTTNNFVHCLTFDLYADLCWNFVKIVENFQFSDETSRQANLWQKPLLFSLNTIVSYFFFSIGLSTFSKWQMTVRSRIPSLRAYTWEVRAFEWFSVFHSKRLWWKLSRWWVFLITYFFKAIREKLIYLFSWFYFHAFEEKSIEMGIIRWKMNQFMMINVRRLIGHKWPEIVQ